MYFRSGLQGHLGWTALAYGIKLRSRHRQWSSHNNTVLPLLPDHDLTKTESRTKRGPHGGRDPGPRSREHVP
ncbi:hypothetical protein TNCV_2930411 [Trichonephila clavipes]|nr:hypothetical protein TNCV_2930411 [Trichonephila clavipes]